MYFTNFTFNINCNQSNNIKCILLTGVVNINEVHMY